MEENQKFNFSDTQATQKIFGLTKRIRAVCGGTSASKTISILIWLIDYAQSRKDKKIDIMSESYPHLKDGAMRDFKLILIDRGYWKDSNWNETDHIYTFETGSIIKFISIDKLGKAHGPRRDVLFINEANNIPYPIYEQLEVRTKEVIWLDWNPSTEFWYYDKIKDKVDHDFITLTYLDCLNVLDPRIVASIESKRDNKNWWLVYGLGQLGEVEGRIYKDWQIIDEIPHEARLERYGLDFGYSCFVGNSMIKCVNGNKKISDIKVGDLVLTRLGYKPVKNVFNNGRKKVLEKEFTLSDGTIHKIIGTPDHNFNVNHKWKTLEKIKKNDRLYSLKEKSTLDTKTENTQTTSITKQEMGFLFSIEKFIRNIKEIFLKDMSFITLTAILLITTFQTLLLSLIQNTLKFINSLLNGIILLKELNSLKKLVSANQIGTTEEKRLRKNSKMILENVSGVLKNTPQLTHIRDFVLNHVIIVGNIKQKKIKQNSYAKTAIKGLWATNILKTRRVLSDVPINLLSVKEIKTNKEYIDIVYNIEVEGIHEYFVNGILVYNCDPSAIVALYRYNGGFILDEIAFQKGLSNKQIADVLLNQLRSLVIADSAEPKSIDEIKLYGITILPSQKGQGSVNQGIQWVQEQRISITKRSVNTIKEYRNYMWKTDKDGNILNVPDVGWDHSMDALRYAIESLKPLDNPTYTPVNKTKWSIG